jgi:hypothetical protein
MTPGFGKRLNRPSSIMACAPSPVSSGGADGGDGALPADRLRIHLLWGAGGALRERLIQRIEASLRSED